MLATTEGVLILDKTDELSEMILQSDIAKRYRLSSYRLKNCAESQEKIQAFMHLKNQYEEVQRFGHHHPNYKQVMKKTREVKREMDLDPLVAEFKLAENDLQKLLDEISVIIGHSISENIKVPTGDPHFENHSGCGGCGSGGCSS